MKKINAPNSTRSRYEAYLGNHTTSWGILGSYNRAIEILYESFEKDNLNADSHSYPLLFLIRHTLELGIKGNISYLKKYSQKIDFTNSSSHNLASLYQGFHLHVTSAMDFLEKSGFPVDPEDKQAFEDLYQEVLELIAEINQLDTNSESFRYSHNNRGERIFSSAKTVNLMDIIEHYKRAFLLLVHTVDVLGQYTDAYDSFNTEQERYYQNNLF